MISSMSSLIGRETSPCQEQPKASVDRWLSLAATPTFAFMALLTAMHAGSMPGMFCSVTQGASPLTGMVTMYLLMSAFHARPWLKLLFKY